MTRARIQPCLRKLGVSLGYYNAKVIWPRITTETNKALFLHNNHFCSIWKSEGINFIKTIKELKDNFKRVDSFITEENVNFQFKYEFIPKKFESYLTNFIVYR